MTPIVPCTLAEQWISLSIDGELSPSLERALEKHLDACAGCRARYGEFVEEKRLLDAELGKVSGELEHLLDGRLDLRTIAEREFNAVARVRTVSPGVRRAARIGWAAAILVAVSLGGFYWTRSLSAPAESSAALLAWQGGGVEIRREDGAFDALAHVQNELHYGETIRAQEGADLCLRFPDGTRVAVAAGEFVVTLEHDTRVFALLGGEAEFTIEECPQGFIVETPAAQVRVFGTRFRVHHDVAQETTLVQVLEGIVSVEAQPVGKTLPLPVEAEQAVRVFPMARGAGKVWVVRTEKSISASPALDSTGQDSSSSMTPKAAPQPADRSALPSGNVLVPTPPPSNTGATPPLDMPPKDLPAREFDDEEEADE